MVSFEGRARCEEDRGAAGTSAVGVDERAAAVRGAWVCGIAGCVCRSRVTGGECEAVRAIHRVVRVESGEVGREDQSLTAVNCWTVPNFSVGTRETKIQGHGASGSVARQESGNDPNQVGTHRSDFRER